MSGKPNQSELATAQRWCTEAFTTLGEAGVPNGLPISFNLGGTPSTSMLATWTSEVRTAEAPSGMRTRTLTLADPGSGLRCRVEVTAFPDFPAVEWVAYFRNAGDADTPI